MGVQTGRGEAEAAFLVVDVQNDFCPGGALAVAGGDEVVAPVNALMAAFPAVVLTQDWHPADHLSFASSHPGVEPFGIVTMPYGAQVAWPEHCVRGTRGADFHPLLATECADTIVRKGFRREIDSYSTFFENDRTTPTGLAGWLRERGFGAVVLAGLATDYCVRYSAIDAVRLGFTVTVVEDACRAIDLAGSLAEARAEMEALGVVFARVSDFV